MCQSTLEIPITKFKKVSYFPSFVWFHLEATKHAQKAAYNDNIIHTRCSIGRVGGGGGESGRGN